MQSDHANVPPAGAAPSDSGTIADAFGGAAGSARRILPRIVSLAVRYRVRFVVATLATGGTCLFNLATPWLLGRAVDQALLLARGGLDAPSHAITITALMLLGVSTLRGGLQMAASYNGEWISQSVARDLRLRYFDALQRLGFSFHDTVDSGDLITRGMLDLEGMRGVIEIGLLRCLQLILLFGIGVAALIAIDPLMALVTLSFVPVVAWRAGRMGLRLRIAWTRLQERMAVLTRVMEENLQGARVVRAFAADAHELARFDAIGVDALTLSNERITIRSRGMATINTAYYASMLLVIAVGAARITVGAISVGDLTRCLAYMTILQLPVRQTSMIANALARAVSSGSRVFEVLDRDAAVVEAAGATILPATPAEVRFEDVSFRYGTTGSAVLDCVSFAVAPGQTLGIVGPSGAGKSTIAASAGLTLPPRPGSLLDENAGSTLSENQQGSAPNCPVRGSARTTGACRSAATKPPVMRGWLKHDAGPHQLVDPREFILCRTSQRRSPIRIMCVGTRARW